MKAAGVPALEGFYWHVYIAIQGCNCSLRRRTQASLNTGAVMLQPHRRQRGLAT